MQRDVVRFIPTRPRKVRGLKGRPAGRADAAAGSVGSEVDFSCSAGQGHKGKVDNPAPQPRRLLPSGAGRPPGKNLRWDGAKVRMKKSVRTEILDADILNPYPGLSPDEARAAWASKRPATIRKTKVKYGSILALLAGMPAETRTQAAAAFSTAEPRMKLDGFVKIMNGMSPERCREMAAAITASEATDGPFRHVFAKMDRVKWEAWQASARATAVDASLEYRTADTARILAAAAAARGETFDEDHFHAGPEQPDRTPIPPAELKRMAKAVQRGGGPKMNEIMGTTSLRAVDRLIGDPAEQFED